MKSEKERAFARRSQSAVRRVHEAEGTASGALVGAVVGAMAGPPGVVAGAIVGGAAGALAGVALDNDSSRRAALDRELDDAIGVSGGDLGAPNLAHPPATVGAYSSASAGVATTSGETPAEGPMQAPEE
ncbi:MAG TPA: YMGG-like glycine zipper-containing protein [Polyangiaceae bacterium]|nr:YMGG-like glycine zipper-containing protein [Polyangiaceae bacterium]